MKFDQSGQETTTYQEYVTELNTSILYRKDSIRKEKADLKTTIARLLQQISEAKIHCSNRIALDKQAIVTLRGRKNREGFNAMKADSSRVYETHVKPRLNNKVN